MKNKNSRGFIKIVLLIVSILVLLRYIYNLDVIGFLTQGRFKELLDEFYKLGSKGWGEYKDIIIKVWNYTFNFIKNLLTKK